MSKRMPLIYVVGPYRAPTERQLVENIRSAEAIALRLWLAGYAAICPHMNTAHFGGAAPDEVWLAGDIEILRRCDAICVAPGWELSKGSIAELEFARTNGLRIFYDVEHACREMSTTWNRSIG